MTHTCFTPDCTEPAPYGFRWPGQRVDIPPAGLSKHGGAKYLWACLQHREAGRERQQKAFNAHRNTSDDLSGRGSTTLPLNEPDLNADMSEEAVSITRQDQESAAAQAERRYSPSAQPQQGSLI